MNDSLDMLLQKTRNDKDLKKRIFATKNDSDPLKALCDLCTAEGFPVTPMEIINDGENSCAAMLRSVNGGGVDAPDGWDDLYEMFFAALAVL